MAFTRDEMERAFAHYQEVAAESARTNEWKAWSELFTEDVHYVEHHYGEFHGRQQVYDWIMETMHTSPNDEMRAFPIEWYVIDEDKGWVVCCIQNVMNDPGDGQTYQAANWTLLKYAGDDRWSYEEDIYSPIEFGKMIGRWAKAKGAAAR